MSRYFDASDAAVRLRAGRWVEQFLGCDTRNGESVVSYLILTREPSGTFAAARFEAFDEGVTMEDALYDFPAIDPDEPYGQIEEFDDAGTAVAHCIDAWGALADRFVGQGMAREEYLMAKSASSR